jgi:uncharacterized protein (TIGR03435 family)
MRTMGSTALLFAAILQGQERPAFEVVSIRPAAPPENPTFEAMRARTRVTVDAARASLGYQSLASLILRAYRLETYQLVAPDWMSTTRFDIAAKLPEGSSPSQVPDMLQSLLAARFRLAVHRDTRQLPVFVLTAGKEGLKLKPRPSDFQRVRGDSIPQTFESLVRYLSPRLERPVLDQTNLQGEYLMNMEDLAATFSRRAEALRAQLAGAGPPDTASDPVGPETFRLIERWGLNLEGRRLPVQVLVVDHAEKAPTEN